MLERSRSRRERARFGVPPTYSARVERNVVAEETQRPHTLLESDVSFINSVVPSQHAAQLRRDVIFRIRVRGHKQTHGKRCYTCMLISAAKYFVVSRTNCNNSLASGGQVDYKIGNFANIWFP